MVRLHRWLLLLVVPLMCSCSEPWQATDGLIPTATPTPSVSASPASSQPPAFEAIEPVSACSLLGVVITADRGDAAAGYREMGLHVRNCGTKPYELKGRPDVVVLDKDGRRLKVSVVASRHYTAAPRRLVLKPGAEARAVLSWRSTVTNSAGWSETGESLAVAVSAGAERQIVIPPNFLDLGDTGRLEAGAWS